MNPISYLKYFWFITRNWNLRLAFFTVIKEIAGEKKYGIQTMPVDDLRMLDVKGSNKKHASIYQGANYFLLEKAFDYLIESGISGGLLDFGCGKGRIMAVAAHYGFQQITGIDFAPSLCNMAMKNITHIKSNFPEVKFDILCEDAVNYEVEKSDNVFFFFNPFDEIVMLPVVRNILRSFRQDPREIYVVYINPVEKEVFLSAGFQEELYIEKLDYLEMSILSLQP